MKKALMAAAILITLTAAAALANASPPSAIELSIEPETGALHVVVTHETKNVLAHHIKTITVTIGGKEVGKREFSTQTDKQKQETTFTVEDIPALKELPAGTEISVTAVCNIYGSKTETIKR